MLTKSQYLQYLRCPQEFWLRHAEPKLFDAQPTLHSKHLREQGYEIERLARKLLFFSDPVGSTVQFGRTFETDDLYATSDIVVSENATGRLSIYEVKSSASVKDEHIEDLAFQKMAAEAMGFTVERTFLIGVNSTYTRNGPIEPELLLFINDVTDRVTALQSETVVRVTAAFEYRESKLDPDITQYCGDKLDCAYIRYNFTDIPVYNVTHINNLNKDKCADLLSSGIIDIRHVPADFQLSDRQRRQVEIAVSGEPLIDTEAIRKELDSLAYPLNFLDYEAFNYAVPQFDSTKPFQQVVFQYSLHTIAAPGAVPTHCHYLSRNERGFPPREVAESLAERLSANIGTVVVWHADFEKSRNKELAEMFPDLAEFFASINGATFDLETVFTRGLYTHPDCRGKTSIKNILPILAPHRSYKDLEIADGTTACIRWYQMASGRLGQFESQTIYRALCDYCHLDTLAMVEIFNVLRDV